MEDYDNMFFIGGGKRYRKLKKAYVEISKWKYEYERMKILCKDLLTREEILENKLEN